MSAQWSCQNLCFFMGLLAPKPYIPHQKSHTKGTSLGCRLAPEMILISHNCAVWAAALSHPTLEYCILGCFWDLENHLHRNWKIFHRCTHAESDSRLLFQKWSKSVPGKVAERPRCLDNKKTKHILATWGRTSGMISPIFLVWVRTVAHH